jgi:hypothetical protein
MKSDQATTLEPYILLNEFALYVKLCQSSELYGLGYGKRYFVPFKEQSKTNGKANAI